MFNLNSQIEEETRRRDAAFAKLNQELVALAANAGAQVDDLKDAVAGHPWQTCALCVGAGVALSTLLPRSMNATAQNVIVEVQPAPNSSTPAPQHAPSAPTLLEIVMLAMNLLGPTAPAKTPDDSKHEA